MYSYDRCHKERIGRLEMGHIFSGIFHGFGVDHGVFNLSNREFIMNLQDLIVYIIGAACLVWVAVHVKSFFYGVRHNTHPCDSCIGGCELRDVMRSKKACASPTRKSRKHKKCCG